MPEEGMNWLIRDEILRFEEIAHIVQVVAPLGIRKIRLTGGEPLMRKKLPVLIEMLSRIEGIEEIAMTTNAFFLKNMAKELYDAGLNRINVSLDSLNPQKFNEMMRRDALKEVLEGLEAVEKTPIRPIKLNCVVIRGNNDDEVIELARLAREKPYIVRFLEYMPIGNVDGWSMDQIVSTKEIWERIDKWNELIPVEEKRGSTLSEDYTFNDGVGRIGFISPVSEPFCSQCDRLRLTSDGHLHNCLFALERTDLKSIIRSGGEDEKIRETFLASVRTKKPGHLIGQKEFVKPELTMSQIGG
jgi:cyclic pyranopterin phosphate synthase